jgi:hypothetical protein
MMRRMILILVVAAVLVAMVALSGPAASGEPPGRAASGEGLGTALQQTSGDKAQGGFSKVSVEYERSQDPLTPGVTPGGGGVEP